MLYRKVLTASMTLALLLTLILTGVAIPAAPTQLAHAQENAPEDARELFTPFWQAWDLLHTNYVDPLDDHTLATGALTGMLQAVNDPLFDFPIPTLDPEAESTDELFAPFWDTWTLLHEEFDDLEDAALLDGAFPGFAGPHFGQGQASCRFAGGAILISAGSGSLLPPAAWIRSKTLRSLTE